MSALQTVLSTLAFSVVALGIANANTITTADGNISVTAVVTSIGPLFQYDYTVADETGQLAVLDIQVSPGVDISGLSAPGGPSAFNSTIDTVNTADGEEEFVSFLENNGTFTSTPESGFIFDSSIAPHDSKFDVTLFDATTGTGNVRGPLVPTPEPGTLALSALVLAAIMFWRKRSPISRPQ
jgi:hypothetical protein